MDLKKGIKVKRLTRDFIAIFNGFWYRDFPAPRQKYVARSNWTIHLGLVIRECADLLGYYASFESGNRTDAVIHDRNDKLIANVEWEWIQPFREKVNEIEKLVNSSHLVNFSVFISYCDYRFLKQSLERVDTIWAEAETPLVLFLVMFEQRKKERNFCELVTYYFWNGKYKKLRSQPALPWEVPNSKWQH